MKRFVELLAVLDDTNATSAKVDAIAEYFRISLSADSAWALFLLSGRKLKRVVPSPVVRAAAYAHFKVPEWLFEEAYANVGDLAETIALLRGRDQNPTWPELSLSDWIDATVLSLKGLSKEEQTQKLQACWSSLPQGGVYLFNKMLTGSFRAGVSSNLVARALARALEIEVPEVALRLMGEWAPTAEFFEALRLPDVGAKNRPYPFSLAHPVTKQGDLEGTLGPVTDYLAEWKWDGIRGQCLRRDDIHLWSRGEELLTERFPEIARAALQLPPGTVLDGEILAEREGRVLPFQLLQQRIQRLKPSERLMKDVPVVFVAFDLLEWEGKDLRSAPLLLRREKLHQLTLVPPLILSSAISAPTWEALEEQRGQSRSQCAEGLMLKRWDAPYPVGRKRGAWWKWKLEPRTIDAVLIYAQAGHGKRSNLHTDYTFAVWKAGDLVPVAKAYSGLTNDEIGELDRWIRRHTIEKFGPVRSVKPSRVFEIAFEGIGPSARHKAGVALRFPRILRERVDKTPEQADQLDTLWELANGR